MITAAVVERFDEQWANVPSLDVRKITPLGSAAVFVAVEKDKAPYLRIAVHTNDECECFSDVRCVAEVVAIGYGDYAHFIQVVTREVKSVKLSGYFGHLYTPEEFGLDFQAFDFLVASADTLLRVRRDGTLIWKTEHLGIDGVIIHEINNVVISGSGEWDPPGGWRPFMVRLSDGKKAI